jgi:hypothetical protein
MAILRKGRSTQSLEKRRRRRRNGWAALIANTCLERQRIALSTAAYNSHGLAQQRPLFASYDNPRESCCDNRIREWRVGYCYTV